MDIPDADSALTALADSVAALADAADQRPQTTDLAVARLKRFLPDPARRRIRLHDLIAGETNTAIIQLEDLDVTWHTRDQQERLQETEERMAFYAKACASLLRLLVVGARFSDRGDHNHLWAECADRLANHRMQLRSGDSEKIGMQFYPALLALYAIALGSAVANRVEPIAHTLATVTLKRPPHPLDNQGEMPVILAMDSLPNSMFTPPATRTSFTAKSDYLLEALRRAAADVIPESERYEDLFDEAEYLLGLACTAQLPDLDWIAPICRAMWRPLPKDSYPDALVERHNGTLTEMAIFNSADHLNESRTTYNQQLREHRQRFYRGEGTAT